MKNEILSKIISIISFALLAMGILVAWNSPATGYEASIYAATPLIFWIGLAVSLITGVVLTVQHIRAEPNQRSSGFPVVPFLLVFLSFAAVLSLFIVRGYTFLAAGDPFTHLGIAKDIINIGHLDNTNIYPITHILVTQYFEICNISLLTLSKLMPFAFALLSVLFTYVFAKTVFFQKGHVILATILSMSFLGGWFLELTPNGLANLMLPLVLFLTMKSVTSIKVQWKMLLIIIIFLLPVFHPIPGFVLWLILLTIPLSSRLLLKRKTVVFSANGSTIFNFNSGIVMLSFVWATVWVSSFSVFEYQITTTYNLITKGGESKIEDLVAQINYAAAYNYNVAEMFFKTYGGLLILTIFTISALIVLWRKRSSSSDLPHVTLFIGPLAAFALLTGALYATGVAFSPLRLVTYIVTICSLFTAFILFEIIKPRMKEYFPFQNIMITSLVSILILILFTLGALELYPSRYILQTNIQVTRTELNGMDWFLHQGDSTKNHTFFSVWGYRFAELFLTPQERNARSDIVESSYRHDNYKIPFHFGYDKSLNLGEYYTEDIYLALNQQDRILYRDVYPEMAEIRFAPRDFAQLENDSSVDRLFDDVGLTIYYIRGLAPAKTQ